MENHYQAKKSDRIKSVAGENINFLESDYFPDDY